MSFLYTFLLMFGFWLILSGKFDPFHLTLGLISCLLVTFISHDVLFPTAKKREGASVVLRFTRYIPWLLKEIYSATLHVAYLALHPKMREKLDPHIIKFKSKLKKEMALVTFANSITLTPGTITIRIIDGEYWVHAISEKAAAGLPGEMEKRIGKVFEEDV